MNEGPNHKLRHEIQGIAKAVLTEIRKGQTLQGANPFQTELAIADALLSEACESITDVIVQRKDLGERKGKQLYPKIRTRIGMLVKEILEEQGIPTEIHISRKEHNDDPSAN